MFAMDNYFYTILSCTMLTDQYLLFYLIVFYCAPSSYPYPIMI